MEQETQNKLSFVKKSTMKTNDVNDSFVHEYKITK